jgi:alkylation response protein AidB-like acyl-CoA dehydrogenase
MLGIVRLAASAPEGDAAIALARRAYTFCGTAAEQVCLDAVQTLGGYGYMKDYGLEKRLRDAKSIQCLLGTYPADILGG